MVQKTLKLSRLVLMEKLSLRQLLSPPFLPALNTCLDTSIPNVFPLPALICSIKTEHF